MKNPFGKTRPVSSPYAVYSNRAGWEWHVLRTYNIPEKGGDYARWFCLVKSPYVPEGEMGDCYASDVKNGGTLQEACEDWRAAFPA